MKLSSYLLILFLRLVICKEKRFSAELELVRRELYANKNNVTLPLPPKDGDKPFIPLIIHQIWPSKTLMPQMNITVSELIKLNPEFKYNLYDDNDCRQLIIQHFNKDTLYSFDHLRPGAYKADLCRYAILYVYGGIYLDIKFEMIGDFRLISLTNREHFVIDNNFKPYEENTIDLYNAFMIDKPKSSIFMRAINIVNRNVKNQVYGSNYLYPTGPVVLGEAFIGSIDDVKNDIDGAIKKVKKLKLLIKPYNNNTCIHYYNIPLLQPYTDYRKEQYDYYYSVGTRHYKQYWRKKQVYLSDK